MAIESKPKSNKLNRLFPNRTLEKPQSIQTTVTIHVHANPCSLQRDKWCEGAGLGMMYSAVMACRLPP